MKNLGLPRKIGRSSSDLPNDPFGTNFARFAGKIWDYERKLQAADELNENF